MECLFFQGECRKQQSAAASFTYPFATFGVDIGSMDSKVLHHVSMIVALVVIGNTKCGHCQVQGRVLMKANQTLS